MFLGHDNNLSPPRLTRCMPPSWLVVRYRVLLRLPLLPLLMPMLLLMEAHLLITHHLTFSMLRSPPIPTLGLKGPKPVTVYQQVSLHCSGLAMTPPSSGCPY